MFRRRLPTIGTRLRQDGEVTHTDVRILDVPREAPPDPEEYLRAAMAWHFGPDTGSPFWLRVAQELDFDPRTDVRTHEDLALFPNLTVAQNIAFGLKVAGMPKADADKRVAEMLDIIKLPQMGDRYPYQLSGGQQQRIALARAIAPKPKLLLLDEPLSALDAKVRVSLREEIRSIQKKLGITTIFVTHDQEEALSISDRIAVMYGGKAEQVGTPFEIYNRPATKFVANFVGTLNVLEGTVTDASSGTVRVNNEHVSLKGKLNGSKSGDTLSLALRPEAISLGRQPGRDSSLSGEISEVHFLGSVIRVRVGIGGNTVSLDTFNSPAAPPPAVGEKAEISFSSNDMLVLH